MKSDSIFDCVIVGAGIIGVTIAKQLLAKNLGWRIAVLERSLIGGGTSRYSAGIHIPYGETDRIKTLSDVSHKEYLALMSALPDYPIYPLTFTGIVSNNTYEKVANGFCNMPIKRISKKEAIPKSIGQLNIDSDEVSFPITGCHYTNVPELISCYVRDIYSNPYIKFWEGVNITNILDDKEKVHLTLQDGRTIFGRNVILAPGPWINDKVFRPLIKHFDIRIKKIVSLHVNKSPEKEDSGLYFPDHDGVLVPYYKAGYWLFSYKCQEWDVYPDSSKLAITPEDRHCALNILKKYCPNLIDYASSGRVFCDAYSSDWNPIVSPLSDTSNIIFSGACGGSGYRLAPAIAEEAISFVLSK